MIGSRNRNEVVDVASMLDAFQEVMGPLPADRHMDPEVKLEEEVPARYFTASRISYRALPGDRVPAWLLRPRGTVDYAAGVLCLHQTIAIGKDEPAGRGGNPDLYYARELVERGFTCLIPDYPGFGEYSSWHTGPVAQHFSGTTLKALLNHMAGLDLLGSLDSVQDARFACIGHSLGGHNALFVAAFDRRVTATVSSCGFGSFKWYRGENLVDWSSQVYMPLIAAKYGNDASRVPFDFDDVLAAIAPRAVFVNAPAHDTDFTLGSVQASVGLARPVFKRLGCEGQLIVVHPEAGHEFPRSVREQAYSFIATQLAVG